MLCYIYFSVLNIISIKILIKLLIVEPYLLKPHSFEISVRNEVCIFFVHSRNIY